MSTLPSEDSDKPQPDTSSKGAQPGTFFNTAKSDLTASGSDSFKSVWLAEGAESEDNVAAVTRLPSPKSLSNLAEV